MSAKVLKRPKRQTSRKSLVTVAFFLETAFEDLSIQPKADATDQLTMKFDARTVVRKALQLVKYLQTQL